MGLLDKFCTLLRRELEKEDYLIKSRIYPGIFCNENTENTLMLWTEEMEILPREFSKLLEYFKFKMPVHLTQLNWWKGISITCKDDSGREVGLLLNSKQNNQKSELIIVEAGRTDRTYSMDSLHAIIEFLYERGEI